MNRVLKYTLVAISVVLGIVGIYYLMTLILEYILIALGALYVFGAALGWWK